MNKENASANQSVLIPAYPAVLRARLPLPVVFRDTRHIAVHYDDRYDPMVGGVGFPGVTIVMPTHADRCHTSQAPKPVYVQSLAIDLRESIVRDALVREIWHKLRPGMIDVHGRPPPDPLTAPHFYFNGAREARLGLAGSPGGAFLYVEFDPVRRPYTDIEVPALATIPLDSFDRELLALAEVAKVVFA
jgi:hypothetical protein